MKSPDKGGLLVFGQWVGGGGVRVQVFGLCNASALLVACSGLRAGTGGE